MMWEMPITSDAWGRSVARATTEARWAEQSHSQHSQAKVVTLCLALSRALALEQTCRAQSWCGRSPQRTQRVHMGTTKPRTGT